MASDIPSVTIYSREGCHLCKVVHRIAKRVQQDLPFRLECIDVDSHPVCAERFGNRIPVVLINHHEKFSGKVTEGQLRKAIERARWRNPVSRILSRLKLALTRG